MTTAVPLERRPLPDGFSLSVFWFALNFHWGALLTIVIPTQVLHYVPEAEKARALGLAVAWGAVVAMVAQPLFGALSDRLRPLAGRRPFLIAGTLGNAAALIALAYAPSFSALLAALLLVQLTNNVAGAAYQGYIPDLVPPEKRGTASGYMGLMTMLGNIAGVGLAGVLVRPGHTAGFYGVIVLVLLLCLAVTVRRVPEALGGEPPSWAELWRSFWVSPRRHPDFAWLFITRGLVMLSFYILLVFLEYYIKDEISPAGYVQKTTLVSLAVLLGATVSAMLAGAASDRLGRRPLVAAAGVLMAGTAALFAFVHAWPLVLAGGIVFGLGYGAFTSVDWALAVDVLPSSAHAAKDLGLWSIASILPQVAAPAVGAWALAFGGRLGPDLAYPALFAAAFATGLLGSVLVWRIRGAR
ncbi:MAG: MFS transporter [Firmicutes bacterium]|nr:MFS transporter [Bacillota bacterium]